MSMTLKELWSNAVKWLRAHKPSISIGAAHHPEIDDDGLISQSNDPSAPTHEGSVSAPNQGNNVVVRTVPPAERQETLQKLQEGFDKLIERLGEINEHLSRQAAQHEDLMGRIQQFPEMLESFPAVVENQKKLTEQLLEQLKTTAAKNEQFIDAVEKIPSETAKQTDALVNIDHQLAAAADIDVQMTESMNNFNESLDKLNQSTINQTDGIIQMSKTFAASDRYLKYIISKQNKRFMWIFIAAVSICVTVILILTGIIIYLKY
jgi:ABC-type transporter Mla subunit MlaD